MKKLLLCPFVLALGCADDDPPEPTPPPTGTLQAALAFEGSTHDVAAMGYRVVAGDGDCADEPIAEAVEPLETEALPVWVSGAGANHAFADALFVLQPGDYRVCITPLQEDGSPSDICAPVDGVFTVLAEQTTEGVLYSQCAGDPSGALDVIGALNNPPHIDDLDIAPSKFITTCERALITVSASDPDGDELDYAWEVIAGPPGANPQLIGQGAQAVFTSDAEGPYTIRVTVSDGLGGEAHLDFPIHVSFEDCAPPCDRQCELLAAQVEQVCLDVIGDFLPIGGEEFCALARDIVQRNCAAIMCDGPPDCRAACQAVADNTRDECLPQSPDPVLCEGGAQIVFDTCVGIFGCPPPPLPCDQQCLADAQAQLDACVQVGADPLICPDAPDPNFQTCLFEAQAALNACVWGPEGCFPELDCRMACARENGEEFLACVGEPRCGAPDECGAEGQQQAADCEMNCCFDECIANECDPQCGADAECLQECARNVCVPQCDPQPPCEQPCFERGDAIIQQCLAQPPQPGVCPDPLNDCVAQGFAVIAECIAGACGGDPCEFACASACIADCEDIGACQQDPALTEECRLECQAP